MPGKHLLIVAEALTLGGLETQTAGAIRVLSGLGWQVHLAVGGRMLLPDLPELSSLHEQFPFTMDATAADLCAAVDRLEALIREHRIDLVHAHPFLALLPAMLASHRAAVPMTLTLHGPASIEPAYSLLHEICLQSVLLPEAEQVCCVSPEVQTLAAPFVTSDASFLLPNGVDLARYQPIQPDPKGPWAMLGRLDASKVQGMKDFCTKAAAAGLARIDVFGDGPDRRELESHIAKIGREGQFHLCGPTHDLPGVLARGYAGVAGMGRVMLEAAAMGIPACLVGYDGVKGMLTPELASRAAWWNLSGRGLATISAEQFAAQLEGLKNGGGSDASTLRSWVERDHNEQTLWQAYAERFSQVSFRPSSLVPQIDALCRARSGSAGPYLRDQQLLRSVVQRLASSPQAAFLPLQTTLSPNSETSHHADRVCWHVTQQVGTAAEAIQRELASLRAEMVGPGSLAEREEALRALTRQLDAMVPRAELEMVRREGEQQAQSLMRQIGSMVPRAELDEALRRIHSMVPRADLDEAYLTIESMVPRAEQDHALRRIEAMVNRAAILQQQVADVRVSRRYKIGNIISALKQRPLAGPWRFLKWGLGLYKRAGVGLAGALESPDPLLTIQTDLEALPVPPPQVRGPASNITHGLYTADRGHAVIFAGVPYDDIGGGQRSAQLTRALLRRFCRVTYVYAFPAVNVTSEQVETSTINLPRLEHVYLANTSPAEILSHCRQDTTFVFELPHKDFLPYLQLANHRRLRTVFELIDDWESSLGTGWFSLDMMKEFVRLCDVNVGTARLLVDRLVELGAADPLYLPNAADESVFDAYKPYEKPADFPRDYQRVLLYFGSMYGEWFAWDYLACAASTNRDAAFLMIGEKPAAVTMPSNVLFIGKRSNEQLPAYLAHSDATLIPFLPSRLVDAVSPVKLFEYLFMGKPVIAARMRELDGCAGVYQADSPEEFARLCGKADLDAGDATDFVSRHSWNSRLDRLVPTGPLAGRFSFIILVHNNAGIIRRCLSTLLHHTCGLDAEIIVVDNASADGGDRIVEEEFPQVRLVRNPRNGCSCGRNLGAAAATGDCLVFLDSDMWFTSSSWIAEAQHILTRHAHVGAVGWAAGWLDPASERLCGPIVDYLPDRGCNGQVLRQGFRTDIAYLGSGAMFIPRAIWETIDGFDEAYDPTCFEDTDLSFQVRRAGFSLAYRNLVGVRHQPHQTTKASANGAAYDTLFRRNCEYFRKKWAAYPHLLSGS